jgi:predicted signal transduction protein with EAL and GGDEF domain
VISVGASIGFCISYGEHDLERLMGIADQALLQAKSNGGGFSNSNNLPAASLQLTS